MAGAVRRVRARLQALLQLHRAVEAAPCGVAHAVGVALCVALQAGALRDEGLLHQAAPTRKGTVIRSGMSDFIGCSAPLLDLAEIWMLIVEVGPWA